MKLLVALMLLGLFSACKPGSKQSAAGQKQADRAAATGAEGDPASAPDRESRPAAARPKGPAGVAPIASAPREHWPCAKTIDSVGARVTYDYTGAPESCWFPPDLWQPGCPTRHIQGNPELGIEIEVGYRYDDEHRLVALSSKLRLASVEAVTYEGDKVVAQDVWTYHPAGTATHMWHRDGSFYASVEPREGVGIARLQTGADAPGTEPATDEQFEYEGDRLLRIRGTALGTTEIHELEYDCESPP